MDIELHGTGRAAGALALAAVRSGHRITEIRGRSPEHVVAMADIVATSGGRADLRVIAVADDAIADVAAALVADPPIPTVHVSGSEPTEALAVLDTAAIGSFHPLQTLPTAAAGAERLPGSWIAVTAPEPFASDLDRFAESLGCRPFRLADEHKAAYHAAAAASANYPLVALGVAERLFAEAGVPFEAARPLVDAIVDNAFSMGPSVALTGPIARGDIGTVRRQLRAADAAGSDVGAVFRLLAEATAVHVDAGAEMRQVIE